MRHIKNQYLISFKGHEDINFVSFVRELETWELGNLFLLYILYEILQSYARPEAIESVFLKLRQKVGILSEFLNYVCLLLSR